METLDPEFSPNKRSKIDSQTLNPPISPSSAKGKAPISDDDDDSDESPSDSPPQNCGICFSEEGKSVRGLIDSCSHYFCFLCIIEWSKIESRCPLCRGRFSTIRRVRKDGSFIGDGCVRIPVRDQIYDPYGEPTDPYAQAKCTVCNGTTDESLLLLCDLCDSAWHTYCVGLGYTVPEGDWFCQDCALLRAEQHDSEMNDNVDDLPTLKRVDEEESSTTPSVSIFDIVRDPEKPVRRASGVDRLRKLASPTKRYSGPTIASGQENVLQIGSSRGSRVNTKPRVDSAESSARTLRNCRNVRKHINVLRDNWNAFRSGSLSFSSDMPRSSTKGGRKNNAVAKRAEKSSKSHVSASPSSFQSKAEDTPINDLRTKNPYDVEKAWKLMNIAKSMQLNGKPKSASSAASSKLHAGKTNNFSSMLVQLGRKDATSSSSRLQSPNHKIIGRLPQRSGKHQVQDCWMSSFDSPLKVQTSRQADIYHNTTTGSPSWRKVGRGLPTILNDDGFACSTSTSRPIAKACDVSSPKLQEKEISSLRCKQVRDEGNCSSSDNVVGHAKDCCSAYLCRPTTGTSDRHRHELSGEEISRHHHERHKNPDNCGISGAETLNSVQNIGRRSPNVFDEPKNIACTTSHDKSHQEVSPCPAKVGVKNSNKIKDEEAKSEIQSLVKLNLKLLSKDKRLETDAFKDIARASTHTILAACGFEHRKTIHSCPTLICNHGDQSQPHRKSTPMPSSCRECFYVFVKNVVNSIMSEKLDSGDPPCI